MVNGDVGYSCDRGYSGDGCSGDGYSGDSDMQW